MLRFGERPKRMLHVRSLAIATLIVMASTSLNGIADEGDMAPTKRARTLDEARARARILHEAFHGSLQVMHRDFFDEDNARVLPSRSLEDVFSEMQKSYRIKIRWLAVNAKAMNVDHEPKDEFEKDAVKAIAAGKTEFESLADETYRHAGKVRLASQCLKCHLPNRRSTADRSAALSITIPLAK